MALHKTIWEDCYLAKNVFSWKIICLFVVECEKVQLSCNWRKMRESSSVPKHSLVVMVNLSKKYHNKLSQQNYISWCNIAHFLPLLNWALIILFIFTFYKFVRLHSSSTKCQCLCYVFFSLFENDLFSIFLSTWTRIGAKNCHLFLPWQEISCLRSTLLFLKSQPKNSSFITTELRPNFRLLSRLYLYKFSSVLNRLLWRKCILFK